VESLPGGSFTGDIDDVKYLRDKLFAALKSQLLIFQEVKDLMKIRPHWPKKIFALLEQFKDYNALL
jgi:inorganic pyrophosphatase